MFDMVRFAIPYLKLMRIKNVDERHFYEIEAAKNDWSLSELKRQYRNSPGQYLHGL